MAENKKKNPVVAGVVALLMSLWFIYDGIKNIMIRHEMKTIGIALLVCGIVLMVAAIIMMCKKPKANNDEKQEKE